MDPEFETAFEVSEHVLEVTRQAYLADDFDRFHTRFHLPQVIGSFEGDRVVETAEDLRAVFERMREQHCTMGVIDMKRHTAAARFLAPDRVQATFVSRFVLDLHRLSDEITAHGVLQRVDGLWKIAESRYATDNCGINRALTARAERQPPR